MNNSISSFYEELDDRFNIDIGGIEDCSPDDVVAVHFLRQLGNEYTPYQERVDKMIVPTLKAIKICQDHAKRTKGEYRYVVVKV